jgi:hypothetical protein
MILSFQHFGISPEQALRLIEIEAIAKSARHGLAMSDRLFMGAYDSFRAARAQAVGIVVVYLDGAFGAAGKSIAVRHQLGAFEGRRSAPG